MKKLSVDQLIVVEEQLAAYQGEDRMVPSTELFDELGKVHTPQYKFKVPSLDRILNGAEPGELIVVTGPTGHGKTTLLMSLTKGFTDQGIMSSWFTLEVTPKQFLKKIAGGQVPPLFYLPKSIPENTVTWIEKRIMEAQLKYNANIVFIDHIHQIFNLHQMRTGNVSMEIGDMVGQIKDIAIRREVVIFLVAHSRDNNISPTAEIRNEDIRDSGMISRQADSIVAVWRIANNQSVKDNKRPRELNETDNRAKVRVTKNRREGTLGAFLMEHRNHLLTEITEDYTEPQGYHDPYRD